MVTTWLAKRIRSVKARRSAADRETSSAQPRSRVSVPRTPRGVLQVETWIADHSALAVLLTVVVCGYELLIAGSRPPKVTER